MNTGTNRTTDSNFPEDLFQRTNKMRFKVTTNGQNSKNPLFENFLRSFLKSLAMYSPLICFLCSLTEINETFHHSVCEKTVNTLFHPLQTLHIL